MLFSVIAVLIYISAEISRREFPFLYSLTSLCYFGILCNSYSNWGEIMSLMVLVCISVMTADTEHCFSLYLYKGKSCFVSLQQ